MKCRKIGLDQGDFYDSSCPHPLSIQQDPSEVKSKKLRYIFNLFIKVYGHSVQAYHDKLFLC